jgi:alanine dehydrogenase
MIVGILKEIKAGKNRFSFAPARVKIMKQEGHTVLVQRNAGIRCGFENAAYVEAGAEIVNSAKEIFDRSEMILRGIVFFFPGSSENCSLKVEERRCS